MKACTTLFFLFFCCGCTYGSPLTKGVENIHLVTSYLPGYATVLISLGALLLLVYFILGCVCCPNKSIKALSYQNGFPVSRLNENIFENQTEITIFPPHSTVIDLQPVSPSFPVFDDKVTFEPLPDILPKNFTTGQSAACSSRPAHFSALLKSKVSLHDWFDDPNSNFPREQLQYLQEIGVGWFGRVVEGEASHICDNEEKTAVTVKILREEASPSEHLHFLHEVRPYRDLKHSNVIKLLGRCLESDPFLLIMEHSICDLKTYLLKQEKQESFVKDGLMLQMISNIASGLRYMHEKGFCHMDFAAHNCFVCSDNSLKIGDYGISFDRWKCDYYCLGDIALPIRWYSPEIVLCSDTTIETKEITREANVWAFGVVLWEIVELGRLPYENLSDEEVLQKVLVEKSVQLSPPTSDIICKDEIVLVMNECWKRKRYRPQMEKIENFITQLYNDRLSIIKQELSFEERWNAIQPRITEISSHTGTESSSLKFENDFSTRSDLQNYSSDNEILSSFEMSFDILPKTGFNGQLSPSLNVLNGSIDELTENDVYLNSISLSCGKYDADTLSNISDKENLQMEEDKENSNIINVSEQVSNAIRDLDLVLASQPDSTRNSGLQNSKAVLYDSNSIMKEKEILVNGVLMESQFLCKSSDLSNISESSFSKSSNFSDFLEHASKSKCDDISANSDLNGNCSFYDNVNQDGDVGFSEMSKDPNRLYSENLIYCSNQEKSSAVMNVDDKYYIKEEDISLEIEPPNPFNTNNDDSKRPSVPDIVIHESPSINTSESLEEHTKPENNVSVNQNTQKTFRFVFKDTVNKKAAEISEHDFSKDLVHNLAESLKRNDHSKPLTSTPVKSSSESISSPLNSASNITGNNSLDDVFLDLNKTQSTENVDKLNFESISCNAESAGVQNFSNPGSSFDLKDKSPNLIEILSHQETDNSKDFDQFTTAQSTLLTNDLTEIDISQGESLNDKTCFNHTNNDTTLNYADIERTIDNKIAGDAELENSNASSTLYVSAASNISKNYSQVLSDVISPPNGYVSSGKENSSPNNNSDIENEYLEHSRASETFSPPQAFQDGGLALLNDSYSESKASFDLDLSTSAECGSSENLDNYLEEDHISNGNISAAQLLETSFPDMESKSFTYENCADFSGNMRPKKHNSNFNLSGVDHRNSKLNHSDFADDSCENYRRYENRKVPFHTYDKMIVEDLDTGEQTVINESYSLCDDYENSGESDEILKINIETDEAIIVDSSEALIGFVPSRSIELLQEFEVIPPLNASYTLEEEKESSDSMNIDAYNSASPSPAAMKHNSSPYESPEPSYPQPYRNFCLQNEVIEEEITDEIVSPSSFHSSSSYCSNEIYMDDEKMSQSSESAHHREYETSVLPSVDHLYVSDDGLKSDISSSECSPVKQNGFINSSFKTDVENNHIGDDDDLEDVMHSHQPTQSVKWLSDEELDMYENDHGPIIIEGREILAGDIIQTCELTAEDIATALNQLEAKARLHGLNPDHLNVSQSPSPFSSVESSPCRDTVYTPDFESDSDESGSGTSCSSTSGSFECIHNKFKNTIDISKVADENDKSASSREQSPMKIFSKTWDCHATPTKGVLVTPEKKFNSLRKSVSFHEEAPQVVFEYPPASDSSDDGYPSDDNEDFRRNIDYVKYADWELQAVDADDIEAQEIVEIEELDSEPYVRRPTSSSVGPLNRPNLYTLTAGFSDEDFDLSEPVPPFSFKASSDDKEDTSASVDQISELVQKQFSDISSEENSVGNSTAGKIFTEDSCSAPTMSVQEPSVDLANFDKIIIAEPEYHSSGESLVVHKGSSSPDLESNDSDDDGEIEEVIIEELSDGESDSDSFEFNKENRPIVLEADMIFSHDRESIKEAPELFYEDENVSNIICIEEVKMDATSSDISCYNLVEIKETKDRIHQNTLEPILEIVQDIDSDFSNNNSDTMFIKKSNNVVGAQNIETDLKLSNDSAIAVNIQEDRDSQGVSVNAHESSTRNNVSHKTNDNISKSIVCNNSDILGDDSQFNLPKFPVHTVSLDPDCTELNSASNDSSNVSTQLVEISVDEIALKPESTFHADILTKEEYNTKPVVPNSSSALSGSLISIVIETYENTNKSDLFTDDNENIECDETNLNNCKSSNKVLQCEVASNISTVNHTEGTHESLISDSSSLVNTSHESSSCVDEKVAQNKSNQLNSSNTAFADLAEVFVSPVTDVNNVNDAQSSKNILQSSEDKVLPDSETLVNSTNNVSQENVCNSASADKQCDKLEILLHVPKIVVTPASESEVEDELEEYLREQLRNCHSEAAHDDFSVTSEFSSRPFDDVFGSYISGDTPDYIEAYNFEFNNGNFFDDYIDDYPQTGGIDALYPSDGRQKRSSSLPLMTENLSDDDSLTMKSDSSLVYDSSKGVTRL